VLIKDIPPNSPDVPGRTPSGIYNQIIRTEEDYGTQYGMLRFIANILVMVGGALVSLAFILPIISYFGWSGIMAGKQPDYVLRNIDMFSFLTPISYWFMFLTWLGLLAVGLLVIAGGEMMKMFISMHDDLSRQSDIVYYMSLHMTKE